MFNDTTNYIASVFSMSLFLKKVDWNAYIYKSLSLAIAFAFDKDYF